MPVIPTPQTHIPESIDPANASVFDPLYKTLARKAVSLSGLNDPQGAIMSAVAPAPLVAKIPFEHMPLRRQALIDALKESGASPQLQEVVEFAAKKYPRVLAHVQNIKEQPLEPGILGTQGEYRYGGPYGGGTGLSRIRVSDQVAKNPPKSIKIVDTILGARKTGPLLDMSDTFGHELTHAAQQIWNSQDLQPLYQEANKNVGYKNNPFEHGANRAAKTFQKRFMAQRPTDPSIISRIMGLFSSGK